MSDYIKTRSKTANMIWDIMCDFVSTGISLRMLRYEYKKRHGIKMPVSDLYSLMQANDYYIFQHGMKYYPYRDDENNIEYNHDVVGDTIRLVECV